MRAPVLLCISQHIKFEVHSSNDSKDIIGAQVKKTGHVTLTTPLRGSSSSKDQHLI